jgi:[ribosomal protein S5]-alanine N-acetyltransferase
MITLSLPETIRTERLMLKRLRYEDAPEIFYGYASKPEVTRWVSWLTHRSVEDTVKFLGYATQAWSLGKDYSYAIRITSSNILAGSIGIINNNGDIQFGYVLGPAHWGKGFATEACRAILEQVTRLPEVKRVSTFVSIENQASIRVLEKCGLKKETLLKKWFLFPNAGPEKQDCFSYAYPLPAR